MGCQAGYPQWAQLLVSLFFEKRETNSATSEKQLLVSFFFERRETDSAIRKRETSKLFLCKPSTIVVMGEGTIAPKDVFWCSATEYQTAAQNPVAQHQRQLSRSGPTYVRMEADFNEHRASILLAITPFRHPQFEKQTLFYPHFSYGVCCHNMPQRQIITTVQNVLNTFYQIGRWDLSETTW